MDILCLKKKKKNESFNRSRKRTVDEEFCNKWNEFIIQRSKRQLFRNKTFYLVCCSMVYKKKRVSIIGTVIHDVLVNLKKKKKKEQFFMVV